MRSSLPESEGHRAKVPTLEAPMPEEWSQRAEQEDQKRDPQLRFIKESLLATKEEMETWSKSRMRLAKEHRTSYLLKDGILKRGTKYGWRTVVPWQKCFDLVRATHRLLEIGGYRGAAALTSRLRRNYYWDGMLTHCEQMCQHCQICRGRDTPSAGGHVATGITQDPPFPFHTISC
eukprot:4711043-Pleurochrysis_carterae.AAC.1